MNLIDITIMKQMKKIFKMTLLGTAIIFASCQDDNEDGIMVQNHDSNTMMQIVHAMSAKMDSMTMTGDPDQDFAMMMTMHHQGAIDMGNEELASGDDATMKAMAQKVIETQTVEKTMLTEFMNSHAVEAPAIEEFKMEIISSMEKMKQAKDLRVINGDTDNDFATLLITHHQSAIEMADAEVYYGKHPEIVAMAQKMITDQQKEIKDLQAWLLENEPVQK